jgi:hypothetical protein
MNIHSFFKVSQNVQILPYPTQKEHKNRTPFRDAVLKINQPVLRNPADIPLIVRSTSVINSSEGSS